MTVDDNTSPVEGAKKWHAVCCKLFVVLFVTSNVVFGYCLFYYAKKQAVFAQQASAYRERLSQLTARVETQQAALASVDQKMQKLTDPFSHYEKTWVLQTIAKQVELLDVSLRFMRNRTTVVQALEQIEQSLIDRPALSALRAAIHQDAQRLRSVPVVDRESVLQQLTDIQTQIAALPVPAAAEEGAVKKPVESVKQDGWGWRLLNALHVTVHYHRQSVQSLPTDFEKATLKQAMYLLLQQAKWALLNEQKMLYQSSLQQTMHYLDRYFSHWQLKTETLVAALSRLKQVSVSPELPLLTETTIALDPMLKLPSTKEKP